MRVLVVHAHPEPQAVASDLCRVAVEELTGLGHTVELSDLYVEGFGAALGAGDFTRRIDPDRLWLMEEQEAAAASGTFVADVAGEVERLRRSEMLLWTFPMWWFGLPAVLKGWVDRVFANGVAYGGGSTPYTDGMLRGRRALLATTSANAESSYAPGGPSGALLDLLLPVTYGTLRYSGFDVLEPFVVYDADRMSDRDRLGELERWRRRLRGIEAERPIDVSPRDTRPRAAISPPRSR